MKLDSLKLELVKKSTLLEKNDTSQLRKCISVYEYNVNELSLLKRDTLDAKILPTFLQYKECLPPIKHCLHSRKEQLKIVNSEINDINNLKIALEAHKIEEAALNQMLAQEFKESVDLLKDLNETIVICNAQLDTFIKSNGIIENYIQQIKTP